jgi:hypothetical protein
MRHQYVVLSQASETVPLITTQKMTVTNHHGLHQPNANRRQFSQAAWSASNANDSMSCTKHRSSR